MAHELASVEATDTSTLRVDLRPLPSLPPPENPLVREGLRRPHRRLRLQPHRPYTRLHPRRGVARRDGGRSYRHPHSSEDDPTGRVRGVPGDGPGGGAR